MVDGATNMPALLQSRTGEAGAIARFLDATQSG